MPFFGVILGKPGVIFIGGAALLYALGWEDLLSPATRLGLSYLMAVLCCSVTNMGNVVRNDLLENKSNIQRRVNRSWQLSFLGTGLASVCHLEQ